MRTVLSDQNVILVMFRAKYTTASSELASMLFSHGNPYLNDGTIAESFLVEELMWVHQPIAGVDNIVSPLATLMESLAWCWTSLNSTKSAGVSSASRYAAITNTVHKYAEKPFTSTNCWDNIRFMRFWWPRPLSQASNFKINWQLQKRNTMKSYSSRQTFLRRMNLLRICFMTWRMPVWYVNGVVQTLSRTVQCVSLVFSHYEIGELWINPDCILFPLKDSFFLTLIVSKVLSNFWDFDLKNIKRKSSVLKKWRFGTTSIPLDFLARGFN